MDKEKEQGNLPTSMNHAKGANAFYGQPTKYIPPKSMESNKLKENPYKNSRILSQPYAKKPPIIGAHNAQSRATGTSTVAPVFRLTVTCTCTLITENRFSVVPTKYHTKLIEVFKTIPSKSFDLNTKIWSFHLSDYALVQERVGSLKPDVSIGQIPKFVLQLLSKPAKNLIDMSLLCSLEPKLKDALMDFQKRGVYFGIEKQGRCLIADEMGLGKTYQALALADFYRDDWPLLICTTAATRDVWVSKIQTLLPYVSSHQIVCMTSIQDYFGDAKILILSYSIMEKNCDKILTKKFGFAIFDESHLLKNPKAKSTNVAIKISNQVKRLVLLTGTPALSRPSELFSQLQMIDKSFFSFYEYTLRYCEGHQTQFGWNANGQANLTELNVILNRKFMIRRTKQDVEMELAEKSRETVFLDSKLLRIDNDTANNMKSFAEDFSKLKGRERDEVLMRYYSETAKTKTKAVQSYLKQLIKENLKFIVFAHHQVMLNAITDCLTELTVDHIRIDGSTRNDLRTTYIERFQTHSKCRVAVLSLKACNSGITLTAAQLVVFAELDWNPSTLAQAESRAHRIGQMGSVVCRYLLAKGTADDAIWTMLKTKQNVLNKAGLFNDDLSDIASTSSVLTSPSKAQQDVSTYFLKVDKPLTSTCNDNPEPDATEESMPDVEDDYFLNLDY